VAFHALVNFCVVDFCRLSIRHRRRLYCDAPSATAPSRLPDGMGIFKDEVSGASHLALHQSWCSPAEEAMGNSVSPGRRPFISSNSRRQAKAGWTSRCSRLGPHLRCSKRGYGALEVEPREKRIGSSARGDCRCRRPADLLAAFNGEDPAEILITSAARLKSGRGRGQVKSARAPGVKCARSWKYFDPATADPIPGHNATGDAAAVREYRRLPGEKHDRGHA